MKILFVLLLLLLLLFLVNGAVYTEETLHTCGEHLNKENYVYTIGEDFSLQDNHPDPCLFFNNTQNIFLNNPFSVNLSYTGYTSHWLGFTFIKFTSSSNITLSNLIIFGGNVLIEASDITVKDFYTYGAHNGLIADIVSGYFSITNSSFHNSLNSGLVGRHLTKDDIQTHFYVSNCSFYNQAALAVYSVAGVYSTIITNNFFAEFTIDLKAALAIKVESSIAVVDSNYIDDACAIEVIAEQATVTNNIIFGRYQWTISESFGILVKIEQGGQDIIVLNNTVMDINATGMTYDGFRVECNYHRLNFQNNIVRNMNVGCGYLLSGFATQNCVLADFENNTVDGISMIDFGEGEIQACYNGVSIPLISGFSFSQSVGNFVNNKALNIRGSPSTFDATFDVDTLFIQNFGVSMEVATTGVFIMFPTGSIIIKDSIIDSITGSSRVPCESCINNTAFVATAGISLWGQLTNNGTVTIENTIIRNIIGANGGDVINPSIDAVASGGNAYGVFSPVNKFDINITNTNFTNIFGGKDGSTASVSQCPGGLALLTKFPEETVFNQTNIFYENIVGQSCNTTGSTTTSVTTTGGETTGTTATSTGETTGAIDESTTGTTTGETTTGAISSTTTDESTTGTTTGETTTGATSGTTSDLTSTGETTDEVTTSTNGETTLSSSDDTTSGTTTTTSTTSTTGATTTNATSTTGTTTGTTTTNSATTSETSGTTSSGSTTGVAVPTLNAVITPHYTSMTIEWSALSKRSVNGHNITVLHNTQDIWEELYVGGENPVLIGNLVNNTLYRIQLKVDINGMTSDPVYYNVTTRDYAAPHPPVSLYYSEFSRHFIQLVWTPPHDEGGLPILYYTLQRLVQGEWGEILSSNVTNHLIEELSMNTLHEFRVSATNSRGQSSFTNANITTAAPFCGDGECDAGIETCGNCFLDCKTCGYKPCKSNCNGHGTCKEGVCFCSNEWSGAACEISSRTPVVIVVNTTTPSSTVVIDDKDKNSLTSNVEFSISFYDISEITSNGDKKISYLFSECNFTALPVNNSDAVNETILMTTLPNNAVITVYISVFFEEMNVQFANQSILVAENGLKYAMKISNWPFQSISNQLMVTMESNGESDNPDNDCVIVDSSFDNSDNMRWLTVTINGAVLYGRFAEWALVDKKIKVVQYGYNSATKLIEIKVPHFWNAAEFDPNFQVLVDQNAVDACDADVKSKSSRAARNAGIAVGVVIAVALVVGAILFVYLRKRRMATKRRLQGGDSKRQSVLLQPLSSSSSSSFSDLNNNSSLSPSPSASPSLSSSFSSIEKKNAASSISPMYRPSEKENPLYHQ